MGKVIFARNPNHQDHEPINLICWPSYNDSLRPERMTDEDFLNHVVAVNIANGTIEKTAKIVFIDDSLLPSDHTYVDAWEVVDGAIIINEAKRKVIAAR